MYIPPENKDRLPYPRDFITSYRCLGCWSMGKCECGEIFFYRCLLGKRVLKKSNGPDEMQRTPCGGTTDSTDNPSQFQPSLWLRIRLHVRCRNPEMLHSFTMMTEILLKEVA